MLVPLRSLRARVAVALLVSVGALLGAGTVAASASAAELQRCTTPRGTASSPRFAAEHPRVLLANAATVTCLQSLLAQKAPSAVRFKAWVDDELSHVGEPGYVIGEPQAYSFGPWFPALLYRVTGEQQYADYAVAFAEHIVAEEEARIARGENASVAFDSYLYVGDTIANVALTYDWCFDRVSQSQRTRWIDYMNRAVANVWDPEGATWGGRPAPWTGWSLENPSNNYWSSFMQATMLLGLATRGENPMADQWITKFRTAKIDGELVPTYLRDLAGGGSREGTGYGTAMKRLFQLYDWWERSTGERIADLTGHAAASLHWMTGAITPTLDRVAPIGDHPRDSGAWLFDYHREFLLVLMSLYSGTRAASAADQLLAASAVPRMGQGFEFVWDYLYEPAAQTPVQLADYSRTYFGSGAGLLTTRSAWGDPNGTFASLVCGPFTESHAHMEHGSFQLFRGEWLAPTGVRYGHSGITGGPDMKNMVRFRTAGGAMVLQDNAERACTMNALRDAGDYVYASIDATAAYAGAPDVQRAAREFLFIRPSTLVVFDRVQSTAGTSRIWTLNLQGAPSSVSGNHLTYLGDEHAGDRLDVDRVAPAGLSYDVQNMDWGFYKDGPLDQSDLARRVDVVDSSGTQTQFLHVLGASINGTPATSSVARDDASGMTGTTFALADGRQVTARFSNSGPGGTVEIRSAGGAVQVQGTLPTTVTVPQAFASADPLPSGGAPAGPPATPAPSGTGGASGPGATPAPAGAAGSNGTGGSKGTSGATTVDPWLLSPVRSGKRLVVAGIRVRPSRAGKCPAHATLTVKRSGRTILRGSVKLVADGSTCRVRTASLRLPKGRGALRVTLSGKGVRARTWRMPAT